MPSIFTETSELLVAFGVLDIQPTEVEFKDIDKFFNKTLAQEIFDKICSEIRNGTRPAEYEKLFSVGQSIKTEFLSDTERIKVEWIGPSKQRKTVSISKDLRINDNINISVKTNSNVVYNLSPHNLFLALPRGTLMATRADHWFRAAAPQEYQAMYDFVRNGYKSTLPERVGEFDKFRRVDRKNVQRWLETLEKEKERSFLELYKEMCQTVSIFSAKTFEANFQSVNPRMKRAVQENILKYFLRLNSVSYLLAGLDGGSKFIAEVPDITAFFRECKFDSIETQRNPKSLQSEVNFTLHFRHQDKAFSLPFHAEIRWSHGKFCGNPEAKLYKDFKWTDVPFFKVFL
jgi:hypothetical protein